MSRPFWSFRTSASSDNCESIEPLLSLAADDMASPEETRRINAHLSGCEGCRTARSWTQATRATLESRPVAVPPPDLHSRIALAIALSSRPVAIPPPDLHSRIALAIAASSAAPSLRPARVFTLRTAYAAAASVTALGIALSYGLLHSTSEIAAKHPAKPSLVASVPATKAPAVPKITKRLSVASVPAKALTVKHTVIAHKTAPIVPAPLAHTASNDVPAKLLVVPQVIKAPVRSALPAPKIASREIAPNEKHSIEKRSIEKHAPLPTLKTVTPKTAMPKLLDGSRVASVPKASVPVEVHTPTVTSDPPVVRTASAQAASASSDNPLGPVLVYVNHASHVSLAAISVPASHRFQEAANLAQTASSGDHVAVLGDIHSP